jgi:hypothetical protein
MGYDPTIADAPGGLNETAAAVRESTAVADQVAASRQADAHRFIVEHGADVVSGHAMVGQPGDEASDPDSFGPDAADL